MKLFLTGGTGFIGSHFCKEASQEGHEIFGLSRRHPTGSRINSCHWIKGDLSFKFTEMLGKFDAFVHFAAHGVHDMHDWDGCFRWNVTESLQLWREAIAHDVRKFLIVGSCFEYGRTGEKYDFIPTSAALEPTGAYHASKAAATMAALALCTDYNLQLCVARPFHIYGDGEAPSRFWPSLKTAAKTGQNFPMTTGAQVRDFTPVEEAVRQLLAELNGLESLNAGCPRLVNIGMGEPQTLASFAEKEWAHFSAKGNLEIGAIPDRIDEVYRYVPKV